MDQTGPARPPMLGGGGGNGGRQRSWVSSPSRVSSLASSSSSVYSLATPPQERFEFCAVIGSGSFGSVYLARDRCPGVGLSPDGRRRRRRRRGTSGGGAGGLLRSGSAEEEEDGDGGDEGEEGWEQGDRKVAIKVVNLEEQEDEMEEIQRVRFADVCLGVPGWLFGFGGQILSIGASHPPTQNTTSHHPKHCQFLSNRRSRCWRTRASARS